MSAIKMEVLSRAEMGKQIDSMKSIEISKIIQINVGEPNSPEYYIALRSEGKLFGMRVSCDALLQLAETIRQSLAPTPEDNILCALGRIENLLKQQ